MHFNVVAAGIISCAWAYLDELYRHVNEVYTLLTSAQAVCEHHQPAVELPPSNWLVLCFLLIGGTLQPLTSSVPESWVRANSPCGQGATQRPLPHNVHANQIIYQQSGQCAWGKGMELVCHDDTTVLFFCFFFLLRVYVRHDCNCLMGFHAPACTVESVPGSQMR